MPGSSPRRSPPSTNANPNAVASTSRLPLDDYVLRKYDARHFPFSFDLSSRSQNTEDGGGSRRRNEVGGSNGARRVEGRNEVGSNGARWKGKGKARAVSQSPSSQVQLQNQIPAFDRRDPQPMERANRIQHPPAVDRRSPPPPPPPASASPPQPTVLRWVQPITQAELDAREIDVPIDVRSSPPPQVGPQNRTPALGRRDPEPMQRANRGPSDEGGVDTTDQTPAFDRRDPRPMPMERANRIDQTPASDSRSDMHHVRRRDGDGAGVAGRGEVGVEVAGRGDGDYGRQRHRRAEGSGGNEGVVLEMTMVGGGVFDV
ncbi:hypothetical protein FA13DRAFT_294835 [Coprinellus micaceus]|uniref:Uncharacterized protein n=1 Tax=Coprinellus micaceus TaxID=71717 RepID=A0A4Y7SFT7_COPMI|nr:hypothetical protein FA13DRAFT_294835 [Coprinellus micaceus]